MSTVPNITILHSHRAEPDELASFFQMCPYDFLSQSLVKTHDFNRREPFENLRKDPHYPLTAPTLPIRWNKHRNRPNRLNRYGLSTAVMQHNLVIDQDALPCPG